MASSFPKNSRSVSIKKGVSENAQFKGGSNLNKLYASAIKFLSPMAMEETYKKIIEEALKLVDADFGSIFLKEHGDLERVYAYPPILFRNKIRKRGFTYHAFLKNVPSVTHIDKLEKLRPGLRDIGIKSTVYVPLINKDKKMGLLSLDFLHTGDGFEKEMEILNAFGTIAVIAIRKAQLYEEVNRALEERDLFISLAAHEIRTPLTVVLLYADLIKKSIASGKTPNEKWANLVVAEAQRLKVMTDELLSIEQIKSGHLQYHFRQVIFSELAKHAIHSFAVTHKKTKIVVKDLIIIQAAVIADPDKLQQVIVNILNNAAKYSPEGAIIDVLLKDSAREVSITIRDKGPGINEEDLRKIFDKYYQSQNTTGKGFGLGLYLAKVIMEMHKGKILAKSKLNRGTEIILKLPKLKKLEDGLQ